MNTRIQSKHHSLRKIIAASCLAGAFALLSLPGAIAQPAGGMMEGGGMPGSVWVNTPTAISIDFRGGSALKYIEKIQDAAGDINIVVKGPVHEIELPEIHLKEVSVRSALELLDKEMLETPDARILLDVNEIKGEPIYRAEGRGVTQVGQMPSVFVVNARVDPKRSRFSNQPSMARVWALSDMLESIPSDDLLSTIDAALPLATEGEPKIDIRFHEETGILIARGEPAALDMIEQTMGELRRTAELRQAENDREQKISSLQDRLVDLEGNKAMREAVIKSMESEQQQFKTRLMELEQQIAMLQQQLQVREERIRKFEEENNQLRRELERKDRPE